MTENVAERIKNRLPLQDIKVGERKIDMDKIDTIVTKVCRDEMCIHKYLGGALDEIQIAQDITRSY